MTSIRLIPCLDVMNGRVVKGINFEGLRDAGDPLELARRYDQEGADELVFLDITASHEARPPIIELAEQVSEALFIPFTVGGGLRTTDEIRSALAAGADKVSLNTAAIAEPALIRDAARLFGSQCIVVAVDARREGARWEVTSHGGRRRTGLDAVEWCRRAADLGAGEILLTSMDGDGTRQGYDLELLERVASQVGVPVIASGGAGTPQHLVDAVTLGRADAVLLAGILHDGMYRITDLKAAMHAANLPMRLA